MVSGIIDMIPDSIDRIIASFEENENEQHLLTLLHKTDNSIYCFLSGNLQGINSGQKIPFGLTLAFAKKNIVKAYYDVQFEPRDADDGHYFLFENESPFPSESEPKVIPFVYQGEAPYTVVDRGLQQMLVGYMEMVANKRLESMEYLGEQGYLRSLLHYIFNKEMKKEKAQIKEAGESLKSRVTELFHEHNSPSTLIRPVDYRTEDRNKEKMFVRNGIPKKYMLRFSLFSLMPYSIFASILEDMKRPYEERFKLMKSKEEEVDMIMSDFAKTHPKAMGGTLRIFELIKHTANIGAYATFGGLTALAYYFTPPIVSYPMIAWASLDGLTMLGNTIRSHGRDSSGILSTLIERTG